MNHCSKNALNYRHIYTEKPLFKSECLPGFSVLGSNEERNGVTPLIFAEFATELEVLELFCTTNLKTTVYSSQQALINVAGRTVHQRV